MRGRKESLAATATQTRQGNEDMALAQAGLGVRAQLLDEGVGAAQSLECRKRLWIQQSVQLVR